MELDVPDKLRHLTCLCLHA